MCFLVKELKLCTKGKFEKETFAWLGLQVALELQGGLQQATGMQADGLGSWHTAGLGLPFQQQPAAGSQYSTNSARCSLRNTLRAQCVIP